MGENIIAVASRGEHGRDPGEVDAAALDRSRLGPGDVVLVSHEIPTATARAALEARPGRRSDDHPEPGTGARA